jgi:kynurenine formamidase
VRLTFDKAPLEVISAAEIDAELERIGYSIKPYDIVLIETGWDRRWPDAAYFDEHPAMSVEATALLVQRGVKVIGIDTNGFDLPTKAMIERYALTGEPDHLWPCHMYGREVEYLQIERLGGLERLPVAHGFKVACFPIRVHEAGAGWARPVAIIDD